VGRFRDGLKAAGVKLTHQRLEIFREVARSAGKTNPKRCASRRKEE
jgi:Fe2+ or Zn2+ uptake regulation protein